LHANIARQAELEQELARRERLSALGRVVTGVAHEVRNPLAAIKLKVQMARARPYAPEKLDQTFSVISAEIERWIHSCAGYLNSEVSSDANTGR